MMYKTNKTHRGFSEHASFFSCQLLTWKLRDHEVVYSKTAMLDMCLYSDLGMEALS